MFIAYQKGIKPNKKVYSSGQLWGTGLTKNSAMKDAKRWVKNYNQFRNGKALMNLDKLVIARVLKANKDLFDVLREDGGSVSFTVRKGRVITVRSPWRIYTY